jgi:hypothetical protein
MEEVIWALVGLMILAVAAAVPLAIILFINRRFKRSAKNRLAQEPAPPPFASPKAAAGWTRGFLGAAAILAAFAVNSDVSLIEFISRLSGGFGGSADEAFRNLSRLHFVGLLQAVTIYATAVPFLIWFHRAHKNLPGLGERGLLFTPGWAVGFFFVPFLNLVRPFQAMREIWYGSDPGRLDPETGLERSGDGHPLGTPLLVGWWWALFFICNISSSIANVFYSTSLSFGPSPASMQPALILMVVADLLLIPSALIAMLLVGRVTRWQTQRAELIRRRGGLPAVTPEVPPGPEDRKATYKFPYFLAGLIGLSAIMLVGFYVIVGSHLSRAGSGGDILDQPSSITKDLSSFSLGKADLVAEVTQWSSRAASYEATGRIVNNGTRTYQFVMVKVEFLDRAGRVVGTLMTEARRDEYVVPGGTRSFTVKGKGRLDFQTARASVVYSAAVE